MSVRHDQQPNQKLTILGWGRIGGRKGKEYSLPHPANTNLNKTVWLVARTVVGLVTGLEHRGFKSLENCNNGICAVRSVTL